MDTTHDKLTAIQAYYSRVLGGKKDLQTKACCTSESLPASHQAILAELDSEILERFYGCGSPIPPDIEGCTLLDLGCGSGRDVYLASKLVGPRGRVIGVDMAEEQLAVARRHVDSQSRRFGFEKANVEFRQGYIEDLAGCGIADNSVDVIVSNCVINLSPDKQSVFSEIFRVLKPGGELYFSNIFVDRRLPNHVAQDTLLQGECLGGALYSEDFRRLLRSLGCMDYRVVSKRRSAITNPELSAKLGQAKFYAYTIRAFKLDCLEDICEDFGQVAYYKGTLPGAPNAFVLDDHHTFYTGKPMLVCGNSAAMVQETRFSKHFEVRGDRSTHFGPFPCGPAAARSDDDCACGGGCC